MPVFLSCTATTLSNTKHSLLLCCLVKDFRLFLYGNPVSSACIALTLVLTGMQSHTLHGLILIFFSAQQSKWQRITYLPSSSHHTTLSDPTGAFQGQSSLADHRHLDSSVVWCQIYWDAPESSLWGSAITAQCPPIATVHQNAKTFAAIPRLLKVTSPATAANTSIAEIKPGLRCPVGTIWLLSRRKPLSICQPLTFLLVVGERQDDFLRLLLQMTSGS